MRIQLFPDDMLPQEKAVCVLVIGLCVLAIIIITLCLITDLSSIPDSAYVEVFNSTITTLNGEVGSK